MIRSPIARADVPGLCASLSIALRRSGASVAVCDVAGLVPDAAAVDALARLQLTAMRLGRRMCVCHASTELLDLVAFVGLGECLRGER
jgi:hypothetical protein